MVDGIHAGHHGGQHLRRAYVGGGFFAPNVLFTGLQGQPVSGLTMGVDAHAHQATGHGAFVFVTAGQIRGMRATRTHGHAKALRGAHHNVSAHLTRGLEQGQREQIGTHDQGGLVAMDERGVGRCVNQRATAAGVGAQGGKVATSSQCGLPLFGGVGEHHFDAQGLGPCLYHFDGLGVAIGVHQHHHATRFDLSLGQGHGLCGGGGLVEHGGIGDGHGGQVAHHGLKVHQSFHAALADFGWVGRVSGVPSGVFQDVAQYHTRCVGAVVTLSDEAFELFVLSRQGLEFGQGCRLGDGWGQLHALAPGYRAWHDVLDQCPARSRANHAEHVLFISRADANVAGNEL